MTALSYYDDLAALFDYPGDDYRDRVRAALRSAPQRAPLAAASLETFAAALPPSLAELQEIFTRSFDVQAITTLSVGYLLFGDDYKRGELLVNLRREEEAAGVAPGTELPDHLPTVLRLIARWSDDALVGELVQEIVRPAVERMVAEFGSDRMQRRDRLYAKHFKTLIESSPTRSTMFREPLAALAVVLDADFASVEAPRRELEGSGGDDFLRSIGRELAIETPEGRPVPGGRIL